MVFWFPTDPLKFLVVPMGGLSGAIEAGASFSLIIHNIGGCRFAVWPSSFPPGPLPTACTYACTSSSLSALGCSCPGGASAPIATVPSFSSPPASSPLPGIQYFLRQFPCPAAKEGGVPGPVRRGLIAAAPGHCPPSAHANQKRSCSACVK
ncbi:unnamed protein product [Ixodes pacificus]